MPLKKTLLFLIFSIIGSVSFAQNTTIDSLLLVLKTAKEDTNKVKILNKLAWDARKNNIDTSITLSNQALTISKKLNWDRGKSLSMGNLGVFYATRTEYAPAIDYLKQTLAINEKINNIHGAALNLNNIGLIYSNQGNYVQALSYYQRALTINEKLNNRKAISGNYNNLGNLFSQLNEFNKAEEYYLKGLKINEEDNNKSAYAMNLSNLAAVYSKTKNYDKSILTSNKALVLIEELKTPKFSASVFGNIGLCYLEKKEYDKALEYLNKSLKINEEFEDKLNSSINYINIGSVYRFKGNFKESEFYFKKAIEIDKEYNLLSQLKDAELNLSALYDTIGDYKKALKHFQIYSDIKDSLFNDEKNKELTRKELNYDYDKKSAIANVEFEKKQSLAFAEIEKNKLILKQQTQNLLLLQQENELNYLKVESQNIELQKNSVEAELKENQILNLNNEKKIKESESKQKELELANQQIELNAKKKQQYALLVGLLIVCVFSIFIYNRFKLTEKQKIIIEHQKEIVEEKHKEITDSINYAERIQRSFLATTEMLDKNLKSPTRPPQMGGEPTHKPHDTCADSPPLGELEGADYFVFFKPKDIVSGDFYWAGELNNGNFAFTCADSTGHGVPGAIMSILNISSLEKSIEVETEPHKILNTTRKIIIERLKKDGSAEGGKDGMDCSLLVINKDKTQLSFAAANNPVWIIRSEMKDMRFETENQSQISNLNSKVLLEFKPDKMPVGKHDKDTESFSLHTTPLQKGDLIYTLTDGFPDQFGGDKGKKYMIKNLKDLLLQIAHLPMQEQKQKLAEEFIAWRGENEQVDDVCIIGVRV